MRLDIAFVLALALWIGGCAIVWVPCIDGPGFFPPPPSVFCPWTGWDKE